MLDDSAPHGSWIIGRVKGAVLDQKGLVSQVWLRPQSAMYTHHKDIPSSGDLRPMMTTPLTRLNMTYFDLTLTL